jgi:acyl-CoA reductase-like NAD-dependent aldehyde dehydrogenase
VVNGWKVGPVAGQDVMLGQVQNQRQYEIVRDFYDDCRRNGYCFATGAEGAIVGPGYLLQPAIIANPPDASRIVMEEPFGM